MGDGAGDGASVIGFEITGHGIKGGFVVLPPW